jgi:hypothetical protein
MYLCVICKKSYSPNVKFNGTFYKTCSICRKRSLDYDNKKNHWIMIIKKKINF